MDLLNVIQQSSTEEQWREILHRALEFAAYAHEPVQIPALMDSVAQSEMDKGSIAQILFTSIRSGHFPRSRKILDYVCTCDEDTASYMKWKNDGGQTMLHVAAVHKRWDWIRTLILKGSDVNAKDDNGNTALFYALRNRSLFITWEILNSETKPELDLKYGPNRTTLVHLAAQDEIDSNLFLKALLKAGAKANGTDIRKQTPLHFAAGLAYSAESMRTIIEAGCDVNAQKNGGDTPLHSACRRLKPGAVKLLLRHGADETLVNRKRETAADVIGKRLSVDERNAEDVSRIEQLLKNAPSDRAWYRRAPVVMCLKLCMTQPGEPGVPGVPKKRRQPKRSCALLQRTDWEEALWWLFSPDTAPEVFRAVVTFLW